jgi:signal transduction histidine kinase
MRRRALISTMVAVLVAVILLGVPLGVALVRGVYLNALSLLQDRAAVVSRVIDVRLQSNLPVNESLVNTYVAGEDGSMRIEVTGPGGLAVGVGEPVPNEALSTTVTSGSGVRVTAIMDRTTLWPATAQRILLTIGLSTVALAAGAVLAYRQANRLSQPLVFLAASAEQLGRGTVRPTLKPSGIEEIDLVAEELARTGDRMAERLAAEREFAGDASHQLRTPLTALMMRLEEIELISDQPEVAEEASIGVELVDRMVAVLEDLRAYSRASLGGGSERIVLADFLAERVTELEPVFAKADREFVVEVNPRLAVMATESSLSQVMGTLLENSLVHGAGTTTVRAREDGQSSVVIEVADEGPGVPEEIASRIFERNVTSGAGTGVGLELARSLAAADGGRLELSQRVPAVFSLFLSRAPRVDVDLIVPAGEPVDLAEPVRRRW